MNIEKISLHKGDAETILKSMDENSIDCVVMPPPYDNMRLYIGVGNT